MLRRIYGSQLAQQQVLRLGSDRHTQVIVVVVTTAERTLLQVEQLEAATVLRIARVEVQTFVLFAEALQCRWLFRKGNCLSSVALRCWSYFSLRLLKLPHLLYLPLNLVPPGSPISIISQTCFLKQLFHLKTIELRFTPNFDKFFVVLRKLLKKQHSRLAA